MLGLQTENGQPLSQSRRRTFIVGFVAASTTAISLSQHLLSDSNQHGAFEYFLTFKLSQDPIETLFSKIRRMGGFSNNPNTVQFKSALKKLLVKLSIQSSKSANTAFDEDTISSVFALKWSKRTSSVCSNIHDDESNEIGAYFNQLCLTNSQRNIVFYIAGYLVRTLQGHVKCPECVSMLVSSDTSESFDHTYDFVENSRTLLDIKNRGGLVIPSNSVYQTVLNAEKIFRVCVLSHPEKYMNRKNLKLKLITLFNDAVTQPTLHYFPTFAHSHPVQLGELCHELQMTRELLGRFYDMRLKFYSKVYNSKVVNKSKGSDRSVLSRLIIFKHQ